MQIILSIHIIRVVDRVDEIKRLEKRVISEEDQIEKLEEKIVEKEDKILDNQNQSLKLSTFHPKFIRSGLIKRFEKHKVLYSFVTLVSVVLIWSGLQTFITKTPAISNPIISISLGLLIVWFVDRELV